jgi:hypothetical protein
MKSAWVVAELGVVALLSSFAVGCASSSSGPKDAGKSDGGHVGDASVEASGCPGIDASSAGIGIPPACETCIGQNCCSLAMACAAIPACKSIEACEMKCVAGGTFASTCAYSCIERDAGYTDAPDPAQNAAHNVDECIGASCSKECS